MLYGRWSAWSLRTCHPRAVNLSAVHFSILKAGKWLIGAAGEDGAQSRKETVFEFHDAEVAAYGGDQS
jgi:hypothetical protein